MFDSNVFSILVFGRESFADLIPQVRVLYIDGTFSITPPLFAQTFVIRGRVGSLVQTLFYALLPDKSSETYARLFGLLKEVCRIRSSHSSLHTFRHILTSSLALPAWTLKAL